MRFLSAETSQAFMRKVILPLAALVVGLLVFAIGGIFWIAAYQTSVAIAQQNRLASGAFRIHTEKLATSANDYGYWDDAVEYIVKTPDLAWMNENIGAGAAKSLGVEMSFALDPDGKPVYSYVNGTEGRQNPSNYLGSGFTRAFQAWKKQASDQTYSGLLPYKNTAVAVSIAPIRSFTRADEPPTGYSIVFVKIIDAPLLQQLARDFELTNLRIVDADADIADKRAVVEITDGSKDSAISRFAWDPQRPGNRLLHIALPFMGIFLMMLILLALVVLNYVVASARLITDRENKASCDPLTGLANRSRFFAALDQALLQTCSSLTGVTVMYIDLDGFKAINDTMGHAAGDELLLQAAARFKSCMRDTDLVARLGGDEFAVIISGSSEKSQIQAVGARILLAMSEPFHLAAGIARASCSIGIADCRDKNAHGADVLNRADRALYQAKASGKNALCFSADLAVDRADLMVA